MRIPLILAPAPYAVVLFRDVGEIQEMGKRACDRQRPINRHARELVRQRVEICVAAGACAFRERAYALNGIEELVAAFGAQRVAE